MDATGDTTLTWNPETGEGVAPAQEQFDHFAQLGYLSYKVDGATGQKEQIRQFDPMADTIIQAVPLQGG